MINRKFIIIALLVLAALAVVYKTMTFHCGPGCTTDPEKIAAGCRACPMQRAAYQVVEARPECPACMAKSEDFFHDSIYTPATQNI